MIYCFNLGSNSDSTTGVTLHPLLVINKFIASTHSFLVEVSLKLKYDLFEPGLLDSLAHLDLIHRHMKSFCGTSLIQNE